MRAGTIKFIPAKIGLDNIHGAAIIFRKNEPEKIPFAFPFFWDGSSWLHFSAGAWCFVHPGRFFRAPGGNGNS
jgi:hypothetical protein